MTDESLPDETKPKRPRKEREMSPRAVAASQNNGRKSKGPTSPEGKGVSRNNSLKHGHCALVVPIPGEDPALFEPRFDAWRKDLNPQGDEIGDYVLTLTVRKSLDLDRLHVARAARLAARARSALADRAARRAAEVHERLELIPDDCGTAVPKLRATTEGCRALIDEWERLEAPLLWPPHWDLDDAHRAVRLQGRSRIARKEAPNVLVVPTDWIDRHRRVAAKLKENEFGPACDPARRYYSQAEHDRDREDLARLEEGGRQGVAWLKALIEAEKKHLRERIEELRESEAVEEGEAALRSRLDAGDDERLLRRYEAEGERSFLKLVKSMQDRPAAVVKSQVQFREQFKSETGGEAEAVEAPGSAPASPPNEPKSEGRASRRGAPRDVETGGDPGVVGASGRPTDPPDRK